MSLVQVVDADVMLSACVAAIECVRLMGIFAASIRMVVLNSESKMPYVRRVEDSFIVLC
jgi:hypothetical protein